MGLVFNVSAKKLLEVRRDIFVEIGIPTLKRLGFEEMPFRAPWFGKNNLGDYTYESCRLKGSRQLEIITTHISKGDRWIKIFLNIFDLKPDVKSLGQLKGLPIIQFYLPPNSKTEMRLRIDDFEGMPLFRTVEHKIKTFYTESGFHHRVNELSNLIQSDLNNIDDFIKKWHKLYHPLVTDWGGNPIEANEK